MVRKNSVSITINHRRRLLAPAVGLGITALLLTGCAQPEFLLSRDSAADADQPVPASVDGTITLSPTHGSIQGGNLVLVATGEGADVPVTAQFGETAVDCHFDELSARHACVAPRGETTGLVNVALTVDGTPLDPTGTYTYTTPGMQDSPMMTVNTDTVRKKATEIRGSYPRDLMLAAVLKNGAPVDVFGQVIHGEAKPEYFFVPTLADAIKLRESGIESRIAVLYVSQLEHIPLMLHYDIEGAAADASWVAEANEVAASTGGILKVHQWIDTGLGREGATPDQALPLATAIETAPHLELVGIATHFSHITDQDEAAIEDGDLNNITAAQKKRFDDSVAEIRDAGLGTDALIHAGASDVLIHEIDSLYYDLLRIGGAFFGANSPEEAVYSWNTQLETVKTLPAGWCIDYDCTTPTAEEKTVGTINHIPRRETELVFTVRGVQVPVLLNHGTVVTLDLSGVPEVAVGEEVRIDTSPEGFYMLDAASPLPVTTVSG